MITIRTRAAAVSSAPLARVVLVASLVGCSSSSNNAGPAAQDGGIDASAASDGSVTDTGAGKVGRTLELTWRVVASGPSRPYVGYDGGGAGAGGGADAGSDEAGADASGAPTDAAVADAPSAPTDAESEADAADASSAATDAESDGSEPIGAADAGDGGAMPLEGLEVCVYQNASIPCVMTDSTGKFTIKGLPAMSDVVISLKKTGYRPTLLAIETGSTNMDGSVAGPYSIPRMGSSPSSSPVAVDMSTKGMVVFFAIGQGGGGAGLAGAAGTMVSLLPAGGDGPYFINDHGALDPSATSVLTQGGVYFNLDAGMYQLTFNEPNHDCASLSIPFGFGFSTSLPNAVKFPIVAGYQTGPIGVLCTPASVLVNTADAY